MAIWVEVEEPARCSPDEGGADTRAAVWLSWLETLRPPELFDPPLTDDTDRPVLAPLLALVRLPLVPVRLSLSPDPPPLCLLEPPFSPPPSSRILGVTTTRPLEAFEESSEFDVVSFTLGTTRVDFVCTGATLVVEVVAELASVDFAVASPRSAA